LRHQEDKAARPPTIPSPHHTIPPISWRFDSRRIFRSNKPDLFLLDIELPDGNGLTLCREFHRNSDAPVLFLTGRSAIADKVTGLSAGGDYYLTKPYDKDELLAVINSLLRREQSAQEKIAGASVIEKGSLTLKTDEKKRS